MRQRIRTIVIFFILTASFWIHRTYVRIQTKRRILINPKQYRFIEEYTIAPSNRYCQKSPFIIMIVTSYVGNFELRNMFRGAMPQKYLSSMNTTRIFLLAQIPPNEKNITQSQIEEENEHFHDILQGTFIEDYRNLTIKHLMGLQWVSVKCQNASYILKLDDDTVFYFKRIFNSLTKTPPKGDFLIGFMQNNTAPKRANASRWSVSLEEYPSEEYPTYVSGAYYITTPAVAGKLVNESMYHPYFWVDDVLITGILTKASNVKLIQLPHEFWFEHTINFVIHYNKHFWDITAYNYSLIVVNLVNITEV